MVMAMTAVTSVMASGNDPQTGTGRDPVGIVAHRGYWNCEEGGYARNSFAAFKAAAQAGFWGTEFDINMTADGQFLVFHDEVIDGRRIDQTDYSALKDYRLENGEPIPTLDEFLEYASAQKTFPMLVFELKGHITDELQDRAVAGSIEKLKEYGMFDPSKVMFISFYIRQCNLLAKAAPGFTVQYLGKDQSVDGLLDNMVNGIDAHYDYLLNTPDYLKMANLPYVDGMHLDYVRFPDVILPVSLWKNYGIEQVQELPEYDFCYCDVCREKFKALTGKDPLELKYPMEDQSWLNFRYDAITHVVKTITAKLKTEGKTLTAAVFPGPSMAKRMVRQDWGNWPLDAYFPMIYNGFYYEGPEWVGRSVAESVKAVGGRACVYAGLMFPDIKGDDFEKALDAAYGNGASGVSFFDGPDYEYLERLKAYMDSHDMVPAN